jgi:bacteriocin-like protein
MKKEKERVFAYTLAKEIDVKDLAQISGGSAQTTYAQTIKATGSSDTGIDIQYDVTVDW